MTRINRIFRNAALAAMIILLGAAPALAHGYGSGGSGSGYGFGFGGQGWGNGFGWGWSWGSGSGNGNSGGSGSEPVFDTLGSTGSIGDPVGVSPTGTPIPGAVWLLGTGLLGLLGVRRRLR